VPAPPGFKLFPNRPDPFGKATEIRFELAGPAVVNLRIYDARGRAVRTLIDGTLKPAGTHAAYWEGKAGSGRAVSPGVYFCRLEVGGRTETQRMVFLK
jgi:flagellar hook assembly protein FlgD